MNRQQARDDILGWFKSKWDLVPAPVPLAIYDGTNTPPPDAVLEWIRVTLAFGALSQQTLQTVGNRRFNRSGILTIQLFTPFARAGQGERADVLAQAIIDALEGCETPGGVEFLNLTDNDIGKSGAWWQTNITSRLIYQQVK